jgi:hypothetical protein
MFIDKPFSECESDIGGHIEISDKW